MNEILKTTKWAVAVTSEKDGEELQKLFPKDIACDGEDLVNLVKTGLKTYPNIAVSACYSEGTYNSTDWGYNQYL